ncbi:hypothetical protein DV515_00010631 [Chloebia gouldiae]|uniref:Uncharacterized protein n=1 Tax=Chloebia gouldiae TaxID=44316 RepID=A0A3L8S9G1_CHLGU|nr:hypothetical protein DV515_00010631 [Chloebia gouldiae]
MKVSTLLSLALVEVLLGVQTSGEKFIPQRQRAFRARLPLRGQGRTHQGSCNKTQSLLFKPAFSHNEECKTFKKLTCIFAAIPSMAPLPLRQEEHYGGLGKQPAEAGTTQRQVSEDRGQGDSRDCFSSKMLRLFAGVLVHAVCTRARSSALWERGISEKQHNPPVAVRSSTRVCRCLSCSTDLPGAERGGCPAALGRQSRCLRLSEQGGLPLPLGSGERRRNKTLHFDGSSSPISSIYSVSIAGAQQQPWQQLLQGSHLLPGCALPSKKENEEGDRERERKRESEGGRKSHEKSAEHSKPHLKSVILTLSQRAGVSFQLRLHSRQAGTSRPLSPLPSLLAPLKDGGLRNPGQLSELRTHGGKPGIYKYSRETQKMLNYCTVASVKHRDKFGELKRRLVKSIFSKGLTTSEIFLYEKQPCYASTNRVVASLSSVTPGGRESSSKASEVVLGNVSSRRQKIMFGACYLQVKKFQSEEEKLEDPRLKEHIRGVALTNTSSRILQISPALFTHWSKFRRLTTLYSQLCCERNDTHLALSAAGRTVSTDPAPRSLAMIHERCTANNYKIMIIVQDAKFYPSNSVEKKEPDCGSMKKKATPQQEFKHSLHYLFHVTDSRLTQSPADSNSSPVASLFFCQLIRATELMTEEKSFPGSSSCHHQGATWGRGTPWGCGVPRESIREGLGSEGPSHHPSHRQSSWGPLGSHSSALGNALGMAQSQAKPRAPASASQPQSVLKGRREQQHSHPGYHSAACEMQALHGSHLRSTLHKSLHLLWHRKKSSGRANMAERAYQLNPKVYLDHSLFEDFTAQTQKPAKCETAINTFKTSCEQACQFLKVVFFVTTYFLDTETLGFLSVIFEFDPQEFSTSGSHLFASRDSRELPTGFNSSQEHVRRHSNVSFEGKFELEWEGEFLQGPSHEAY